MKKVRNSRASQVALATLLFLAVTFESPPSVTSMAKDRPPPPTQEEIQALIELSEWVLGGSSAPRFRAFSKTSLRTLGEDDDRGFDLFRGYHGVEAQESLIERLPFGDLIRLNARRYGLDPLLIVAMIEAESSFDPDAVSVAGALGLMQLLPTTAELYTDGDPLDPTVNIHAGSRYLKGLMEEFEGDVPLALAAYNAGPGNVRKHGGVPPFAETRRYVERVMARYIDYHQRIWQESPDRDWFL